MWWTGYYDCNHTCDIPRNRDIATTCTMSRYCQTMFSTVFYYLQHVLFIGTLTLCSCLLIHHWRDGIVCRTHPSIMCTCHLAVVIVHTNYILSSELVTLITKLKLRSYSTRPAARCVVSRAEPKVDWAFTQRGWQCGDGWKRCQSRKKFDFESVSVRRCAVSSGRQWSRVENLRFHTQ